MKTRKLVVLPVLAALSLFTAGMVEISVVSPLAYAMDEASDIYIGTVNVGSINVRSTPKIGVNVIGHLKKGDKVTVHGKDASNFWCKIDYKDYNEAWVACKLLKF